jgi:hypothetical protein
MPTAALRLHHQPRCGRPPHHLSVLFLHLGKEIVVGVVTERLFGLVALESGQAAVTDEARATATHSTRLNPFHSEQY